MLTCMYWYRENENEVIYLFGDPSKERRGIMRIDKNDLLKSEIVKLPDDGSCDERLARHAIVKLIKKARGGEYPEKLEYCPGW